MNLPGQLDPGAPYFWPNVLGVGVDPLSWSSSGASRSCARHVLGQHEMPVIEQPGHDFAVGNPPGDDRAVGALGLESEERAVARLGGEEMVAVVEDTGIGDRAEKHARPTRPARTTG